jgi:type IV pilus assembly protein PilV
MAAFDLDEVRAAIHRDFPGGRILVCRDSAVWQAARKALVWECAGGAGAPLGIKIGWRARRADGAMDSDAGGAFPPAIAMAVEVLS